ncbi:exosortase N [Chryseolinea sp. T2]|uniref:exosortase N n=1 Tax=Chryseolinea sp. T2 TaxID=3129255 RepID=UPI0030780FA4
MARKARYPEVMVNDSLSLWPERGAWLRRNETFAVLFILTALSGGVFCFPASYVLHTNVIVGLLLLPFVTFIAANERRNNFWLLIGAAVFCAIALCYNMRLAYFFTLSFIILWVIEYCIGRSNALATFLLVFMSPVFDQAATILGFPIRLKLSAMAGSILRMLGIDAIVEGNSIILDKIAFTVDDACMGLNMLALSMLIGTFLLSYQYRSVGKTLKPLQLVIYFAAALILNLVTNLCRIVVLVVLGVPPEAASHEIIGLMCFVCYTVIPLYFISGWIVKRGQQILRSEVDHIALSTTQKIFSVIVVLLVASIGVIIASRRANIDHRNTINSAAPGTQMSRAMDVKKIFTNNLLVYVKPIPEWFTSEHTPLYCWKGSGYVINKIREVDIAGRRIYIGRLVKSDHVLFTAWWYSNGKTQTISQFTWRSEMLTGAAEYYLINVTASSEQTLIRDVEQMLLEGDEKLLSGDEL